MSKPAQWKIALQPFADSLAGVYRQVFDHVRNLSDEELDALDAHSLKPTQTNCGWDVYRVAAVVRGEIVGEKRRRLSLPEPTPEDALEASGYYEANSEEQR